METFFDSRLDLLQRQLQKQTEKLKTRAEDVIRTSAKIRTPGGEELNLEVQKLRLRVRPPSLCVRARAESTQMTARMSSLSTAWQSAKVVRTREKISFFFGVHSLLISALLFAMAPQ
jgi:hypothetical protein